MDLDLIYNMKHKFAILGFALPISAFSGYFVFALYNYYYNYKEIPITNAVTETEMIEQEMNAFSPPLPG